MLQRPFGYWNSSWREMERLRREMNRLFSGAVPAAPAYPAMNIWTNDEGAIVTAELPGIDPEAIDISVTGDTLTLTGARRPEETGEGVTYHRRERGFGRFARALQLPFQVESGKVEATFEKGVLQISLPRAEADKPRKIAIRAG